MKKFLALMLALVMALSLAACGGGSSSGGDAAVERTDTTTVAVGAVILARDDVAEADIYNLWPTFLTMPSLWSAAMPSTAS